MPVYGDTTTLNGLVAVLGGSFDPIHLGHLHIARQILCKSPLKEVLFVPSGKHNFKKDSIFLDYDSRYQLVHQAIETEPGFAISAADKKGSGYTAHLMQKLKCDNPAQDYVFIIGSDNLQTLPKWYDYAWLRENVVFIILPRPDFPIKDAYLDGIKAFILDIELSPISSTQIRNKIHQAESIHGLVPEKLEQTIYDLYRNKQKVTDE